MKSLHLLILAFIMSLSSANYAADNTAKNIAKNTTNNTTDNTQKVDEITVTVAIAPEAEPLGPVQTIQSAIVTLNQLTAMNDHLPHLMGRLIETEIAPLFDFDHIAGEIMLVGNLGLGMEERIYFVTRIKQNIINSLLSKLTQTRSTSFEFVSAQPMIGGSISVRLKVNGYYAYGMFLDLIFHQASDQSWKIADIVLNNDSLINYYQKMVLIKLRRYGLYGMLGRL